MLLKNVKTVGIVGAGTMGLGIAQVCAQAGYTTLLFDARQEAVAAAMRQIELNLDKGIKLKKLTRKQKEKALERLEPVSHLKNMKADLIIEAVVERLEVKHQIFETLEKNNTPQTILATNTSSIPITQIAAHLKHPERVVGMHFFNPAHIMKLVEIIAGAATSEQVVKTSKGFAEKLGKTAIIAKDSPGFIVNRVARHYYVESLLLAEEGLAGFSEIDDLLEASGFKMGPFRLMDLIGVDTNFSVTTSMYEAFWQAPKFRPSRIQQQKVDAGHWGRKSGRGFYSYEKKDE
ncbi:3-hydroxyacyl-CoA dehydrogenase family protein [Cesiribacter andamanensis]|uniref:Putative 3-hydroxybutyryl-CoA dehydrogenase n=1 Tax=Cesiribacter andamanensis AMV16 TaxID=1279009 RepID=M7N1V4_9BACT|nr:3-hydroxyacyl-CoA dehydrogenase NAD-binding domain-containing protein [Cesiribacter andamanensis]EMR02663.1 putative 3-hydroxybutyryl-CoA dehydrogenase [Cesiribacter andamanensis AMV16]